MRWWRPCCVCRRDADIANSKSSGKLLKLLTGGGVLPPPFLKFAGRESSCHENRK